MKRLFSPLVLAADRSSTLPAVAQTPPTQGWPANRPPTVRPTGQAAATAASARRPPVRRQCRRPTAGTPAPVPLPHWFAEIDIDKTGEVSRADFLKYRMKSFEELDANKDGKLSLEEFLKVAEPPFSQGREGRADPRGAPQPGEGRSSRTSTPTATASSSGPRPRRWCIPSSTSTTRTATTRSREPELRLIVQRSLAREAAERQQMEAQRRQGKIGVNDFIDMQLREADKLDKNGDGKVSQQEYLVLAGPADGAHAKNLLPYDIRKQLVLRKFQEIDTNKDGQLDRVELTGYAVKQFIEMDTNKDRFLTEEEFKKAQENETKKMRAFVQTMQPRAAAAGAGAGAAARRPSAARAGSTAGPGAGPAAGYAVANLPIPAGAPPGTGEERYSTVTLLARLRGWSTSVPLATAV